MGRRPRCAAARRSGRGPGPHRYYRRHRAALWREPDRLGGGGEMAISWSRPSGDLYQIFDVAFVIWPPPWLMLGRGPILSCWLPSPGDSLSGGTMAQTEESQSEDIEIPIIEISAGWTVDEIKTLDDCDDAFAYLTGAVCAIENKIDVAEETGGNSGFAYRKLKRALRWKKAALQVVQTKRGRITREAKQLEQSSQERRLLNILRERFPAEFEVALKLAE